MRALLGCALAAVAVASPSAQEEGQPLRLGSTAAAAYTKTPVRGFDVRIAPDLIVAPASKSALGARVLDALDRDLAAVCDAVPAPALAKLRAVPIFVNASDPVTPCACYHVSATWLEAHGFDPAKAKSIEIANAAAYLEDRIQQRSLVLHELSHAYHDGHLRTRDDDLRARLTAVSASGMYDRVLRSSGTTDRHYALTNIDEYFAETSEALWGVNDFYPFVRAELVAVDPLGAELVRSMWDPATDPNMKSTPLQPVEPLVHAEIVRLHAAFEVWFERAAGFDAIDSALGPDFTMVSPDGTLLSRATLVDRLTAAGGKRRVSLDVHVVSVTPLGATRALAVYEETQTESRDATRTLVSTAILERAADAPGGLVWQHVHETLKVDRK